MPELHKAGVVYTATIANFYYQSNGFTKFYTEWYAIWKIIPMLVLIGFVVGHGGGIPPKTRLLLTLALTFGMIGDYLIGISNEGIVTGAIAFGIGHMFYMLSFVPDGPRILWPLVPCLLAWGSIVAHCCLLPMLSVHPGPVLLLVAYSLLLTFTVVFAASQFYYGTKSHPPMATGLCWRLLAFVLFYISDSVLIFNHTGYKIKYGEIVILSTYYASQYLLVRAAMAAERYKPKMA